MTTITLKIPEKLGDELNALAAKKGVSKSALVREAIAENVQRQKQQGQLSAHEVMKKACGMVRSGRRDLATNPRHLEGLGRD